MKVWVTKKALTSGILEFEVNEEQDIKNGMLCIRQSGMMPTYYHGDGRDWHRALKGAQARARFMRNRKLNSLKVQAKKIKAMDFGQEGGDEEVIHESEH